jgi:hypothetical protein
VSKSESQKARIKLYRRNSFRRELADGLGLGGIKRNVASCLDALLSARRLPSRCEPNSRAAAMDAALILIAIGTNQTNDTATVSMTDRLGNMKLHEVIDTGGEAEREVPVTEATDLAADLAGVFEEYWQAPDGAFLKGLCHTAFMTTIADVRADDGATLVRISDERRRCYSATIVPAEEYVHHIRPGGLALLPSSLANFAEQLRHDLDGTAAAFRKSHHSAEERAGLANARVMSTSEFAPVLIEHVGDDLKACADPLLRFQLLGRAVLAGIEYHRDGGPDEQQWRLAAQVIEIGRTALETAERHPEGWVVVDAFGRPCSRLGEGRSEFHRGAEIITFASEDESARFAARVNAQPGDDPALPVLSLSARRFAKEAAAHAESYRRIITQEGLDIRTTGDVMPPL